MCEDQLENTVEKCTDGIDNDGNSFTDCEDFSCRQANDITVAQVCQESLALVAADADERCSDGQDNDGDGLRGLRRLGLQLQPRRHGL